MTRAWLTEDVDTEVPPALDPDAYGGGGAPFKPPIKIEIVRASAFGDVRAPDRRWLVKDWVPDRAVTMLSGDGGVGKSLVAMQLGVAVARGTEWLGTLPEPGPVLYVSAEDDLDEIHRRLTDVVGADLCDMTGFHILCLAGRDAVMATSDGRGIVHPTELWRAVASKLCAIRPRLVVLDNLADVFAGNENARPEARQFVGLLRSVAIELDLAVLLIAHPSLSGIASGSGTSGSTAWSNSVRSRLYLDRAKADNGDEPDPDLRILRLMKANYSPTGTEVRMRWERGRFKVDGTGAGMFDRLAAEQHVDQTFMTLLKAYQAQGRDVSPNPSNNFAPNVFAKDPEAVGITRKAFGDALNRLFKAGTIKAEKFGPPSKLRTRLVPET